jgi:hypothetical protein
LYNNYQKPVDGIKKPIIKTPQVNFKDSPGVQMLVRGEIRPPTVQPESVKSERNAG